VLLLLHFTGTFKLPGLVGFSGRATAFFRLIGRLLTVQLSKLQRMWIDYLYEDGWKRLCSLHERRSALIGKSSSPLIFEKARRNPKRPWPSAKVC
jgi:hypothetical protein